MRNLKCARILTAAVIAIAFSAGSTMADDYFKQVVHSDAFEIMGQKTPEKNDTTVMWLTDGKACSLTGSEAVIFNGDEGAMYMIDHEKKEYMVVPMDLFGGGEEGSEAEGQSDEMKQMMAMAQAMMGSVEVEVTPTDETKEIGDWEATKFNVEVSMGMMKSQQEMWTTEDIEIDYTMCHVVSGGMMSQMPGYDKIIEKMKQVKGMPVLTVATVSMMGNDVVTTTELIEYAEKDAPDGVFEIPEGYKKTEMSMGMGGKH